MKQALDPKSASHADKVLEELRFQNPERLRERNLTSKQEGRLRELLREYAHVFLLPGAPLRPLTGQAEGVEFEVNTGNATPVYRPPFIRSPDQLRIPRDEIQKMIELDAMGPVQCCRGWGPRPSLSRRRQSAVSGRPPHRV